MILLALLSINAYHINTRTCTSVTKTLVQVFFLFITSIYCTLIQTKFTVVKRLY